MDILRTIWAILTEVALLVIITFDAYEYLFEGKQPDNFTIFVLVVFALTELRRVKPKSNVD